MQEGYGARDAGVGSSVPPSVLQGLRHPRLLSRSIAPSFSLQSQLLGAEFCASISAAMVQLTAEVLPSHCTPPTSEAHPIVTPGGRSPAAVLLHDLSAHYGSHALRRGGSRPLGPCYKSRRRRLSSGHHDGRRHLWSLRASHRLWCRCCGVYLVPGRTKTLLCKSAPSPSFISGDRGKAACTAEAGMAVDASPHSMGKTSVTRGSYVCCRCFDRQFLQWRRDGHEATPSHAIPSHSIKFNEQPGSANLFGGSHWMNVLSAARVGRTCRRKRKRREGALATLGALHGSQPAVGVVGTRRKGSTTLGATLHAVPKGSLTRRKRGRGEETNASVAAVVKESGEETREVGVSGGSRSRSRIERGDGTGASVRKAARMGEERTVNPTPHALEIKATRLVPTKTEKKSGAGALCHPVPPSGRRPAPKKANNSSGTSSTNSFADTMSKLGL